MYDEIETRVTDIAEYVAATGATVRDAAKLFGVSKSTVHTAVTIMNGSCGNLKNARLLKLSVFIHLGIVEFGAVNS